MRGINSEQNRAMRRWLRETYRGACAYCQRQIGKRGTVDHYLPKALGGGNGKHNLRWCCIACNRAKADMHPSEWETWPHRPAPRQPTRAEVRQHLLQLASPLGRLRALGATLAPPPPPPRNTHMKVRIEAEVEVPDGTPIEHVEEWLRFYMGYQASMSGANQLVDTDLQSVGCSYVYASEA